MRIGYFLSCEEYGVEELLEQARLAEDAGFEALWISDHYHPWKVVLRGDEHQDVHALDGVFQGSRGRRVVVLEIAVEQRQVADADLHEAQCPGREPDQDEAVSRRRPRGPATRWPDQVRKPRRGPCPRSRPGSRTAAWR